MASVTYTFTNGTTADATEVNQNFTDLVDEFNTTTGHDHDGSNSKTITTTGTLASLDITTSSVVDALDISQGENDDVIDIDKTGTGTGNCIDIDNDGTGHGIYVQQDGVLGATHGLYVYTNAAQVTSDLAHFKSDNASSTDIVLRVTNDGTGKALFIDQNGAATGIRLDGCTGSSAKNPENDAEDGFIKINIDGTDKYIPYYTA